MKIFFDIVIILITNLVVLKVLYILNPELSYYRKKSKVKKWKRHSIYIVENVDNLTELFLRVNLKMTEISFEDIVFDIFNNQYTPDEVLQVYYEKIEK